MVSQYEDVKRQVAVANRILADVGLAVGIRSALGHASLRVPSNPDQFVVKGRQYAVDSLATMRPEDMVVCDTDGFLVEGSPGLTQCSEIKIHSCIYKTRPEIQSVVHVHPRYTVLASVLGLTLRPMCQEGIELVRHPLPVYPHVKTIQSDAEGMELADQLGAGATILLQGHGAVTTGESLSESVTAMIQLEEQAWMNYLAFCAMGRDYPQVPDHLIDEMTDRAPLHELPHFQEVLQGRPPQRDGIWNYRVERVSQGL
ncbi:MAG: class II aldolase/adducin family protein [Chloroflexi bacterium]|nr:class II aldolase/adducin family protein [Chloroflexota bacterium]